jgi:hypothetical protein
MRQSVNRQKCTFAEAIEKAPEPKTKFVTAIVFEEEGRTILQPLVMSNEAERILELLQNNILEVWMPNGQSSLDQFDISILKYRQLNQPMTKCRTKTGICLKNHFDTIISCEQCPLIEESDEQTSKINRHQSISKQDSHKKEGAHGYD